MIETILIARERKSGKQVILQGSEVEFHKQKAALHEFDSELDETYDRVGLYSLTPMKRVLQPLTKKQKADRTAQHEALINASTKPAEAPAAPDKAAELKLATEKALIDAELEAGTVDANFQSKNEFTASYLNIKTRGELLAIATVLVDAKRLAELPSGNKSKIIEAILNALPKPEATENK